MNTKLRSSTSGTVLTLRSAEGVSDVDERVYKADENGIDTSTLVHFKKKTQEIW